MNDLTDNSPQRSQESGNSDNSARAERIDFHRDHKVYGPDKFVGHPNVYCTIVNSEDSLLIHFIAEHMTRGTRTLQELADCLRNYRNDNINQVTNRILTLEKDLDARITEGEKLGQKYVQLRKERDLLYQQVLDHQMNIGHLEHDNDRLAEEIVRSKGLLASANQCTNEWSASAYKRGEENAALSRQLRDKDIELQKCKLINQRLLKSALPTVEIIPILAAFSRPQIWDIVFDRFVGNPGMQAPEMKSSPASDGNKEHLTDEEYHKTVVKGLRDTIAYLEKHIKDRVEKNALLLADNQLLLRIRGSQAAYISTLHKKVVHYESKYGYTGVGDNKPS